MSMFPPQGAPPQPYSPPPQYQQPAPQGYPPQQASQQPGVDPMAAANAFLAGGAGRKSITWPHVGATVVGRIIGSRETQATDFKSKAPEFWPDGQPKMQLVITIGTDQRDPSDPNDNGERDLYLKGSLKDASTTAGAFHAAIQASGQPLQVGGIITMAYIGDGVASNPSLSPPKMFTAQYQGPGMASAVGQPAPQPAMQQPQPQYQQPPVQQGPFPQPAPGYPAQ